MDTIASTIANHPVLALDAYCHLSRHRHAIASTNIWDADTAAARLTCLYLRGEANATRAVQERHPEAQQRGSIEALLCFPQLAQPTDHDLALALLSYRLRLSAAEIEQVLSGHMDLASDEVRTLIALTDPTMLRWTAHVQVSPCIN